MRRRGVKRRRARLRDWKRSESKRQEFAPRRRRRREFAPRRRRRREFAPRRRRRREYAPRRLRLARRRRGLASAPPLPFRQGCEDGSSDVASRALKPRRGSTPTPTTASRTPAWMRTITPHPPTWTWRSTSSSRRHPSLASPKERLVPVVVELHEAPRPRRLRGPPPVRTTAAFMFRLGAAAVSGDWRASSRWRRQIGAFATRDSPPRRFIAIAPRRCSGSDGA